MTSELEEVGTIEETESTEEDAVANKAVKTEMFVEINEDDSDTEEVIEESIEPQQDDNTTNSGEEADTTEEASADSIVSQSEEDTETDQAQDYETSWTESGNGETLEIRNISDEEIANFDEKDLAHVTEEEDKVRSTVQTNGLLEEAIVAIGASPRLFSMAAAQAPLAAVANDTGVEGGDVNTPYIKTGTGTTSADQKPVTYTVTATPNHATGKVDFVFEYRVDRSAMSNHNIYISGLQFGDGFNVPSVIPIQVVTDRTSNTGYDLRPGGTTGSIPGYSLIEPVRLNQTAVAAGTPAIVRFSVDVADWNGDLTFDAVTGMFNQNYGGYDFDSPQNYFRNDGVIGHDFNPEYHMEQVARDTEVESIPFETIYRTNPNIPAGQSITVQEGINGQRSRTIIDTYYDGELISSTPTDWTITQPSDRIVELGIGVPTPSEDIEISEDIVRESIAHQTIYRPTIELEVGETRIVQTGQNGFHEKSYEVRTYTDGRVERDLIESELTSPIHEIIEFGIQPVDQPAPTPILPGVETNTERGTFNGSDGTWVTITFTNPETGEELDEHVFFIPDGQDGEPAETPHIGDNGNWYIGDQDTGIPARGPQGEQGEPGEDGTSPTIDVVDNGDGTYTITITNPDGTTSETVVRDGVDGEDGQDGQNTRNW